MRVYVRVRTIAAWEWVVVVWCVVVRGALLGLRAAGDTVDGELAGWLWAGLEVQEGHVAGGVDQAQEVHELDVRDWGGGGAGHGDIPVLGLDQWHVALVLVHGLAVVHNGALVLRLRVDDQWLNGTLLVGERAVGLAVALGVHLELLAELVQGYDAGTVGSLCTC